MNVTHDLPTEELNICAWNINGGLNDKLGMPDVQNFLCKHDLILLCETWLYPWDDVSISSSYTTINIARTQIHPNARRNSGGLIVAFKNSIEKYINVVSHLCDHIAVIKIKLQPECDIFIIIYLCTFLLKVPLLYVIVVQTIFHSQLNYF